MPDGGKLGKRGNAAWAEVIAMRRLIKEWRINLMF